MRLDMNRICQLAGIKSNSYSSKASGGILRESSEIHEAELEELEEESHDEGSYHEGEEEDLEEADEEMIEIDEVMLVQELRRAKRLMKESKARKLVEQQNIQEAQLKAIIDQEVKNIIKEMQLTSGWVYGNKKPTRSKKGYTHQGSFLKGIGFK